MTEYTILITKQAKKDRDLIKQSPALRKKVEQLIELLKVNPLETPPRYEKLIGELDGLYSRRINVQHRLVYEIREDEKSVVIYRMWTHYE